MAKKAMAPQRNKRLRVLVIVSVVLAVVLLGLLSWLMMREQTEEQQADNTQPEQPAAQEEPSEPPQLNAEVLVDGRQNVWDMAFLPSGEMLFTERSGVLSIVAGGEVSEVADIEDVYAQGEGGLLGLTVDPEFEDNNFIYTCFNSTLGDPDVRVVRWQLSDDLSALEEREDIVTAMPSNNSGRHSGCRVGFGPDGNLWVATGDAAQGTNPQDPQSLGGKILRVNRDGSPASELNQSGDFDPRVYSYGHRNSQGLAFLQSQQEDVFGVSAEHGPDVDDEINLLQPGNFGWDPVPGYNESVPMTDTDKFPDARPAVWSSGDPTQAPSGATFVSGSKWKAWDGALAVAFLKDQRLKFFSFDDDWQLQDEQERFAEEFGRLRAAVQGPDQNLYISTDNDQDDKIIRITPQ